MVVFLEDDFTNCWNLLFFQGDYPRNKRGKAYRLRTSGSYVFFEAHDGVMYKPGDFVFIELSQCEPYGVGLITSFKMVNFRSPK